MFKFVSLLKTNNKKETINLGEFLLQAFEERKKTFVVVLSSPVNHYNLKTNSDIKIP